MQSQDPLPSPWQTLSHIKHTLHLSSEQMAQFLCLSDQEYQRYRLNERSPPVNSVMEFGSKVGLGFDSIMKGSIDYKCLAQNFFRESASLPERYSRRALSKRRTVTGILDSIENLFGFERRATVMRRFQVNEAMFVDRDAPINMQLALDIADYFHKLSGDIEVLRLFGEHSVMTNRQGEMGRIMQNAESPKEAIEVLIDHLVPRFVEQNYTWRILKTDTQSFRVAGVPIEEVRNEMLQKPGSHRLGCQIRAGFIGGAVGLAGFSPFKAIKTACASEGAPWCEFEFFSPNVMPLFAARKSERLL